MSESPPPQSVAPLSITLDLDGKSAEEVFDALRNALVVIKEYAIDIAPKGEEGWKYAWRSALTVFDPETGNAHTNQLISGFTNKLVWDENKRKVLEILAESE